MFFVSRLNVFKLIILFNGSLCWWSNIWNSFLPHVIFQKWNLNHWKLFLEHILPWEKTAYSKASLTFPQPSQTYTSELNIPLKTLISKVVNILPEISGNANICYTLLWLTRAISYTSGPHILRACYCETKISF